MFPTRCTDLDVYKFHKGVRDFMQTIAAAFIVEALFVYSFCSPSFLARLAVQVVCTYFLLIVGNTVQRVHAMYYNDGKEDFASTYLAFGLGICIF